MALEIVLPALGENVASGEVVNILVSAGDAVKVDQPLMEVETGKATAEIPAPLAGTIERILVKVGDPVKVGQALIQLRQDDTAATLALKASAPPRPVAAVPVPKTEAQPETPAFAPGETRIVDFTIPGLGENIDEGEVVRVLVSGGDQVDTETALLEIETGKATAEVPAAVKGRVLQVFVKPGDRVKVGQTVFKIETTEGPLAPAPKAVPTAGMAPPAQPAPAEAPAPTPPRLPRPDSHVPVRAAPSVRKLARELGVDVSAVQPAAADGRITPEDVKAHVKRIMTQGSPTAARGPVAAPPLPDFTRWGEVERRKMSMVRRTTAEHMAVCWSTIPMVTQHDVADITKLEKLRKKYAQHAESAGGKLTVTAVLLKIVASALKAFPDFNASVDMATGELVYKKYVNVGIAVDTPKGLLVPVVRDVDRKNIVELSVALTQLSEKARKGKTPVEDLSGGCFTITNLGSIGGGHFTPIVNYPEVGILGVGRAAQQPVYIDEAFQPRLMMPLSLSYDHRIIDGAAGARFLRWIVEAVSEPFFLALEG